MRPTEPRSERYLLTGGSGFIGTNLLEHLLSDGISCLSLDPSPPRNPALEDVWVMGDVRDTDQLIELTRSFGPTHVLHLGARTDMEGETVSDYKSNTDGVRSVVTALERAGNGGERTVFASTRLVTPVGYEPTDEFDVSPDTPYGESKVEGERIVRESNLNHWVIVRPTSIWGPWFGVPYRQFFDNVLKGRYVHPRGETVRKTFGFVGNSVNQLLAIARGAAELVEGRTFYIGDEPIEVGAFADAIADEAGIRRPRRIPAAGLVAAARAGDVGQRLGLFGAAPLTSKRLFNLRTDMVFDITPTFEVTPDRAVPVEQGIRSTLRWMCEEPRPER